MCFEWLENIVHIKLGLGVFMYIKLLFSTIPQK